MKLRIVALGHRLPSWVAEAYADYARRMPRALSLELVELKAEPRDRG
jgi:23S rRNA (pseudouridine1915-N3)-methyltransferase